MHRQMLAIAPVAAGTFVMSVLTTGDADHKAILAQLGTCSESPAEGVANPALGRS